MLQMYFICANYFHKTKFFWQFMKHGPGGVVTIKLTDELILLCFASFMVSPVVTIIG